MDEGCNCGSPATTYYYYPEQIVADNGPCNVTDIELRDKLALIEVSDLDVASKNKYRSFILTMLNEIKYCKYSIPNF